MKTTYKTILIILSLGVCFMWTHVAYAFGIHVEKPEGVVKEGDTVLINVFVDTGGEEINAVEGVLSFSDDVSVKAINTGGSLFSLWPVYPAYKNKEISFVGGTPSSVFGSNLRMFSVAVTPEHTGIIQIGVSRVVGYRADGSGTAVVGLTQKGVSVPVAHTVGGVRNDLDVLYKEDTKSPQKFRIEYGREQDVYDGKVFLSFYTTDAESGVSAYEVIEGGEKTLVYGNTYVLKNQQYTGDIVVTAIDAAGNRRSETIAFGRTTSVLFAGILIICVLIIAFFGMWWYKKKDNE